MDKNKLIIASVIILATIFGISYFYESSEGLNIYKNEQYGFSIKYPADWNIQENFEAGGILKLTSVKMDTAYLNNGLGVHAGPIPENIKKLEDIKNIFDTDPRFNETFNPAYNSKIEKVGRFQALVVRGISDTYGGPGLEVIILNNNSLIQFSGNEIPEHEKILNSIRSL